MTATTADDLRTNRIGACRLQSYEARRARETLSSARADLGT
jgi:hypothetical protein